MDLADSRRTGRVAALALAGVLVVGLPAGAAAEPGTGSGSGEGSGSGAGQETVPSSQLVHDAQVRARAAASSLGQLQARLARADNRLRRLDVAAQQAVEHYSTAVYRRTQAADAVRVTTAQASAARRTTERRRQAVAEIAAATYRLDPGLGPMSTYLDAAGPEDLLDQTITMTMVSATVASRYEALRVSQSVSAVFEAQARDALDIGRRAAAAADTARRQVKASVASQSRSVDSLTAQKRALLVRLARLERVSVRLAAARQHALERRARQRAEEARKRAEERRRDLPPDDGDDGGGGGGGPTTRQRERAVGYALAQLGEPYVFGADGPDSWDCSGLTMRAWEAAGVSMPHFARGQYWQSKRIRLAALRRGDLVFWASDPEDSNTIHHVAMYLGRGRMVHAPRPGRDVERRSLWYMGTPTHVAQVR
ncbi:C40 family peptidase [Actinopolymorpha sp. B9G3]|uniref:C40 family peptidase n=1 Tax=Actinopolymorpha sp. B9G3 TaxID=3158970 RepID=UPI0032D98F45